MIQLQADLVQAIKAIVASSPRNRLPGMGTPIFDEPLVGFADGDDPLFDLFKSVVAPEHLAPREGLAASAPGPGAPAFPNVGVVSWVLPVAAGTKLSNRQMSDGPSPPWNQTRFRGEAFNDYLRRSVVRLLGHWGLVAVAPALSLGFRRLRGPHGEASTWSERHVAYAAGLGTFGLSDGLITARGIAHRCGSVVVNVAWPASDRPYSDYRAYCPYAHDRSCGACIERCPAGAIGPDGHDKDRCQQYIRAQQAAWQQRAGYRGTFLSCGLCQTAVPCESRIPSGPVEVLR